MLGTYVQSGGYYDAYYHDAALALGAEALAACVAIHIGQRIGGQRTESITDPVIPRQVGTRLGGSNDVVTRDGVLRGRQADLAHFAPQGLQLIHATRNQVAGFARQVF